MKRHCFWRSVLLLCCFFLPTLVSAAPLELLTSVSKDPVVPGEGFFYRLVVTIVKQFLDSLENCY